MRFIRKPKEVEAIYFDGTNAYQIIDWSYSQVYIPVSEPLEGPELRLTMDTKYGTGHAYPGTWVIKGPCGLYYPCSDKEFKDNYWELK